MRVLIKAFESTKDVKIFILPFLKTSKGTEIQELEESAEFDKHRDLLRANEPRNLGQATQNYQSNVTGSLHCRAHIVISNL